MWHAFWRNGTVATKTEGTPFGLFERGAVGVEDGRIAWVGAESAPHFTPYSARHTFASLLLQQGESPAYVQRQFGHASIKLTVETYGRGSRWGTKQR